MTYRQPTKGECKKSRVLVCGGGVAARIVAQQQLARARAPAPRRLHHTARTQQRALLIGA